MRRSSCHQAVRGRTRAPNSSRPRAGPSRVLGEAANSCEIRRTHGTGLRAIRDRMDERDILPRIRGIPLSRLMRATGLSLRLLLPDPTRREDTASAALGCSVSCSRGSVAATTAPVRRKGYPRRFADAELIPERVSVPLRIV